MCSSSGRGRCSQRSLRSGVPLSADQSPHTKSAPSPLHSISRHPQLRPAFVSCSFASASPGQLTGDFWALQTEKLVVCSGAELLGGPDTKVRGRRGSVCGETLGRDGSMVCTLYAFPLSGCSFYCFLSLQKTNGVQQSVISCVLRAHVDGTLLLPVFLGAPP